MPQGLYPTTFVDKKPHLSARHDRSILIRVCSCATYPSSSPLSWCLWAQVNLGRVGYPRERVVAFQARKVFKYGRAKVDVVYSSDGQTLIPVQNVWTSSCPYTNQQMLSASHTAAQATIVAWISVQRQQQQDDDGQHEQRLESFSHSIAVRLDYHISLHPHYQLPTYYQQDITTKDEFLGQDEKGRQIGRWCRCQNNAQGTTIAKQC